MVKKCMKCGGTMKKGGPVKQVQPAGVPPPPSRSQYRSQIEDKYKAKYYTKDNIYIGKPERKVAVDKLIEKQTDDSMRNRDKSIKSKQMATPAKKMQMGGSMSAGIPYKSGAGATDGKNGMMKKGGAIKKMAKGGSLKSVPTSKVGLAKLPTAVRNKMGYKKTGGSVKKK
jgi:hypothetical protein